MQSTGRYQPRRPQAIHEEEREEPVYWNISLCGHHGCQGLHQPCFELPSVVVSAVLISGLVHFSWSDVLDPKSA